MTNTLDIEAISRPASITAGDTTDDIYGGGVWLWQMFDGMGGAVIPLPSLPRYGMGLSRDRVLAGASDLEPMWASIIAQAASKYAVRGFTVKDSEDSTRRTEASQNLLLDFGGPAEYTSEISATVRDYMTCDLGVCIEIDRQKMVSSSRPIWEWSDSQLEKASKGKPQALYHLDSLRCRPTGNRRFPMVYTDLHNVQHVIPYYNLIHFSDEMSPRLEHFRTGRCSTSRAWDVIITTAAMRTYFKEKVTGSRALALYFVSGVSKEQLRQIREASDQDMAQKGFLVYKGAVVASVAGDRAVEVARVDLASIPDGFNADVMFKDAYLVMANAAGFAVQDVQPLSGQGLGTGAQSVQLDESASQKGIEAFGVHMERRINRLVLPKTTTFTYDINDLADQKAAADVLATRATALTALIAAGVLRPEQALNMLVDSGEVPAEFLPEDETAGGTLTDSGEGSKPVDVQALLAQRGPITMPLPPQPQVRTKAKWRKTKEPTPDERKQDQEYAYRVLADELSSVVKEVKPLTIADLDEDAALEQAARLWEEVRR